MFMREIKHSPGGIVTVILLFNSHETLADLSHLGQHNSVPCIIMLKMTNTNNKIVLKLICMYDRISSYAFDQFNISFTENFIINDYYTYVKLYKL